MVPELYRVQRVRQETHDTFTLELRAAVPAPRADVQARPVQHALHLRTGEVPISVSGNPTGATLVHTTRAVGRVTHVMSRLRAGDVIGVRGPFGTPWPIDLARDTTWSSWRAGIGLPPLRPVIYHVLAHRGDYGRVVLLYGTRTPEDILFRRSSSGGAPASTSSSTHRRSRHPVVATATSGSSRR